MWKLAVFFCFFNSCICTPAQNYASSESSTNEPSDSSFATLSSVDTAEFDRLLAENLLTVTVPLDLDKAEEILMQYSSEEWSWMDIRVDPFNVPGRVDSNLQIFLRMITNLILKSETVFQPTPSGLFYEFRTFGQTSLNKTQLLKRCEFVGRIFGTAALGQAHVELPIPRALYKLLIHGSNDYVTLDDIEEVDRRAYRHLFTIQDKLKDNSTDISLPFRTLTYEYFINGKTISVTHNLSKSNSTTMVTRANFEDYARAYVDWVLFRRAEEQIVYFCAGFLKVFPRRALQSFVDALPTEIYIMRGMDMVDYGYDAITSLSKDAFRLEEAIRGKRDLDINDWAASTEYKVSSDHDVVVEHPFGFSIEYLARDPVVEGFWNWARALPSHLQRALLLFTTGSYREPVLGFGDLKNMDNKPMRFSILPGYKMFWDLRINMLIMPSSANVTDFDAILLDQFPEALLS